jgi:hypothetical protein
MKMKKMKNWNKKRMFLFVLTMFFQFNGTNIVFSQKYPEIEPNSDQFALIHYNIDSVVVDSIKVEQMETEIDSIEHQLHVIEKQNDCMKSENEKRSLEKQIISTIIALFILISIWNRKQKNQKNG